MRNVLRLSAVLVVAAALLFAQGDKKGGKKGPPTPTNLQILPAENLMQTMQAFSAALGVMCTHCHVQGNFASDDMPQKGMARNMIMMAREINSKFPDGERHVSCYTCHRGMTTPAMAP